MAKKIKIQKSWIAHTKELERVMKDEGIVAMPKAGTAFRIDRKRKKLVMLCNDIRLHDDDFLAITKKVWAAIGYKLVEAGQVTRNAAQFDCPLCPEWMLTVEKGITDNRNRLNAAIEHLKESGYTLQVFGDRGGFVISHQGIVVVKLVLGTFLLTATTQDKEYVKDMMAMIAFKLAQGMESGLMQAEDLLAWGQQLADCMNLDSFFGDPNMN